MSKFDDKFVWIVKNYSALQRGRCYSLPFQIRDIDWHLKTYSSDGYLCLFLEVAGGQSLPSGWTQYLEYQLTIVNQNSKIHSVNKDLQIWFDENTTFWGFKSSILLSSLNATNSGFMVNGEVMITVQVNAFAPIGVLLGSQDLIDESEWTPLGYSTYPEDEEEEEDVNGFQVSHSQVNQVKEIFEKHPDFASNLSLTTQWIKDNFLELLLDLIETLNKSPKELTEEDLKEVDNGLSDLTKVGFKVDWLRQELDGKQKPCDTSNIFGRLRGFYGNFFE